MTRVGNVILKRKPVPREWRDANHYLHTYSQIAGGGWGGHARVYRAGGDCSCGAKFGLSRDDHTADYSEVLDEWKDHVAQAFHGEDYYTRKEIEVPSS